MPPSPSPPAADWIDAFVADLPPLATIADLATLLHIGPAAVRKRVRQGQLPRPLCISGRLRVWPRHALHAYLTRLAEGVPQ